MTAHTPATGRGRGLAPFGDSRLGLWHLAAAIASGALLAVSHGLHPLWPLAWIAPVPVLVAVVRLRWPVAAGLGALAGAIASVSLFGYMLSFSTPLGVVMLSVIRAAQWGTYALVGRIALRRLPAPAGILVLPALMAGFEVCQARISRTAPVARSRTARWTCCP